MNKFFDDLRALSPADLLIVILAPVGLFTLSAVFFLG